MTDMTREEIVDLLTFARVYDNRLMLGQAETASWYMALRHIPYAVAEQAVTAHYSAPVEPGSQYPRIVPGHIVAYYQARNRPDAKPVPALDAPKASPEFAAKMADEMRKLAAEASSRFAPEEEPGPDQMPQWRPGADKQELARRQAEASRRRRHAELDNLGGDAS